MSFLSNHLAEQKGEPDPVTGKPHVDLTSRGDTGIRQTKDGKHVNINQKIDRASVLLDDDFDTNSADPRVKEGEPTV